MGCDECERLSGAFLETIVAADRAETALRGYFLTHQHGASVSEFAEYKSMRAEMQRMMDERDRVYTSLVNHKKLHGRSAGTVGRTDVLEFSDFPDKV